MDTWDRINESVRVVAQKRGRVPPRGLLTASGNPWERDRQRVLAVKMFLSSVQIYVRASQPDKIADELDELALQPVTPERIAKSIEELKESAGELREETRELEAAERPSSDSDTKQRKRQRRKWSVKREPNL